jgi:preprotein translocase subunit SecE
LEWNPATWVQASRQYLSEVKTEFRKVTWPSQREYVGGTIGVVVVVAFLTFVLGLADVVLGWLMELVVR